MGASIDITERKDAERLRGQFAGRLLAAPGDLADLSELATRIEEDLHRVSQGLYRVCQECLHNVAKHSKATQVAVDLSTSRGETLVGGTLDVVSTPGAGTRIEATVPEFTGTPRRSSGFSV